MSAEVPGNLQREHVCAYAHDSVRLLALEACEHEHKHTDTKVRSHTHAYSQSCASYLVQGEVNEQGCQQSQNGGTQDAEPVVKRSVKLTCVKSSALGSVSLTDK